MWSFVFQKTQAKREVYSWKMVGCKKCHMSFPFKAKTNRFFPHSLSWKRNTVFLLELLGSAGPWGSLETHRVLGDAGSVLGTSATCWNYSPKAEVLPNTNTRTLSNSHTITLQPHDQHLGGKSKDWVNKPGSAMLGNPTHLFKGESSVAFMKKRSSSDIMLS